MDKRCSKCDELKPATEYYTYFHSTQQKHRTRNICQRCVMEGKRKYRESIKEQKIIQPDPLKIVFTPIPVPIPTPTVEVVNPLSLDPNYKLCRTCQEYKHDDDYYHHNSVSTKNYLDCRKCCNIRERDRRREERQEELENCGGSEQVKSKVGMWVDEYQKIQTYKVMEILGYIYDEESGHFLKPGVKELIDGKLVFHKVRKKVYTYNQIKYPETIWEEITDLYNTGKYTFKKLGKKYGVSQTTVCKHVHKINQNRQ